MSYAGKVYVKTDGGTCFPFSPSMEAIATNEVSAKVNDQDVFLKAASVQTGNKVLTEITYSFNIKASGSATGFASAEASITMGYTEKIERKYGEKEADIIGFGTKDIGAAQNHAMSAHMESVSRVAITGESFSWATGYAQSLGMGIWYAGVSTCPGITEPLLGWVTLGTEEQRHELEILAQKFTSTYKQLPPVTKSTPSPLVPQSPSSSRSSSKSFESFASASGSSSPVSRKSSKSSLSSKSDGDA